MSGNWVVQNLQNALEVWNGKLGEIRSLLTQSPQTFRGGLLGALIVGVMKTCWGIADEKVQYRI